MLEHHGKTYRTPDADSNWPLTLLNTATWGYAVPTLSDGQGRPSYEARIEGWRRNFKNSLSKGFP